MAVKTVTPATAEPEEVVTYTLALTNASDAGMMVRLTDTLPLQVDFLGPLTYKSGAGGYASGVITWAGTVYTATPEGIAWAVRIVPDVPDSATITNALIYDHTAFLVIGEVEWVGEPDIEIVRKFQFFKDITELSHEGNRYLYMAHGHPLPFYADIMEVMNKEFFCFFEFPLVYRREGVYVLVVGSRKNIRLFCDFVRELGIGVDVMYVKEYHVKGRAILSELTDRQYECMKMAKDMGYFDIPKKADLREVAERKWITHGALAFHIRKAQRTIVNALFS